ncbi:MAG: protein translocase subunit SecF, partial [Alphaproteobacteria bacterium HGW-Alphaproteobacteria-8]
MRLRLIPQDTHIDFMAIRHWTVGGSAALIVASLVALFALGLNFGIDFRGGVMIMAETEQPADIAAYRSVLSGLNIGDISVTSISDPAAELTGAARNAVMVRIGAGDGSSSGVVNEAIRALEASIPTVKILSTDAVGAKVSGELLLSGVLAVLLAVVSILFYIWLRFEWQFSVGAVVALAHDVMLTIGLFSLTQIEFNLSIIAALLTIVGYSLNDTVVVFDRIRENLRKFKKMPLVELLNLSINETLSRTLMTSGTTLIALLA